MKTTLATIALLVTENSAVQLSAEGVPVLVMPKLLPNLAGDMDLRQRGYIIDGVDGYDLVQLKDDVPADDMVLQVNGVPVLVNPKLLVNTAGDIDLRLEIKSLMESMVTTMSKLEMKIKVPKNSSF